MAKSRVRGPTDADLQAFIKKLASWDGEDPAFQDILIDAATHAGAIRQRNKDQTSFVHDLHEQTNLPESIIKKWIAGQQLPNKKLARTVVNEIRLYLSRRRIPSSKRSN